jgi:hypothetical protein
MDRTSAIGNNTREEAKTTPITIRTGNDEIETRFSSKFAALKGEYPGMFNNPGQMANEICIKKIMVDAASLQVMLYKKGNSLTTVRQGADKDGEIKNGGLYVPIFINANEYFTAEEKFDATQQTK